MTSLDLNIEKIKSFDITKQDIDHIYDEETLGLNKFGLFNSIIEVNTNQNANPINKIQVVSNQPTICLKSIIHINYYCLNKTYFIICFSRNTEEKTFDFGP